VSDRYLVLVFRIGHRTSRDKRITTHLALVSRAFGASGIIIAGENDAKISTSVRKVVSEWGGEFMIKFVPFDDWKDYIDRWKEEKRHIIHLTMYGANLGKFQKRKEFIQFKTSLEMLEKTIIIVGGKKVPGKVFRQADWNIAVTNQPHSEVGSLAVFLNHLITDSLDLPFTNPIREIKPSLEGKKSYKEDIENAEQE
jgi:tRNA (cytidine56-2'-O)-methyltransferase